MLSTTAKIQDNWRLYSQNLEEGGALPTEFVFGDESIFDYFSIVSEPKPITKYDPIFQMDQSYFINEVIYSQEVVLKGNCKGDILTQNLYYQVCDDRVCIFQDVKLEYSLSLLIKWPIPIFFEYSVKIKIFFISICRIEF